VFTALSQSEKRANIKFFHKTETPAVKTPLSLSGIYGNKALKKIAQYEWYSSLKNY
jgi:hypothetical protein